MKHIVNSSTHLSPTPTIEQIQPNAVDLRIDRVWKLKGPFIISESGKTHRDREEVNPNEEGYFELEAGTYEVAFEGTIQIGADEAGWVITRSTLNRNGLFLTSGLYDSGYHGAMAGCLHIEGGSAYIKKGTRIGQFLLFDAEALHSYDGSYGFDASGQAKADEARYHNGAN